MCAHSRVCMCVGGWNCETGSLICCCARMLPKPCCLQKWPWKSSMYVLSDGKWYLVTFGGRVLYWKPNRVMLTGNNWSNSHDQFILCCLQYAVHMGPDDKVWPQKIPFTVCIIINVAQAFRASSNSRWQVEQLHKRINIAMFFSSTKQ